MSAKAFAYEGKVMIETLPKMRAMAVAGLCIFLDIDPTTWSDYGAREDFTRITSRVDEIIRTQKFQGARCRPAEHHRRDLGLAESQRSPVRNGGALKMDLDAERFTRAIAGLAARGGASEKSSADFTSPFRSPTLLAVV